MKKTFENIKNIVVLMPDKHMGNLIVSVPAITALRDFFAGKNFFLVVDEIYKDIGESVLSEDNLILFPRQKIKKSSTIKKLVLMLQFFLKLRRSSPDIIIDLGWRNTSSIITILSLAPIRIGSSSAKRPWVYNLRIPIPSGTHKAYAYSAIASKVGAVPKITTPFLQASQSSRYSLKMILLKENIDTIKPIVCIHPGDRKIYKQWTSEGFAEIGDSLASFGFQVVFVGHSGDSNKMAEILSGMKKPAFNLSNKLTLGELMALFEIGSLFIGNDSGPMHLASAMGIPVIALFGPGNENRWKPLAEDSVVLRGEPRCQKCKGRHCDYDFKCIKTISADKVKTAAERLLKI